MSPKGKVGIKSTRLFLPGQYLYHVQQESPHQNIRWQIKPHKNFSADYELNLGERAILDTFQIQFSRAKIYGEN